MPVFIPYVATRITITPANTNINLLTAIQAAVSAADAANISSMCRELGLKSDLGNTAGSKIFIGDASMSATRYGYDLGQGDARVYRSSSTQDVPLGAMYIRTDTDNSLLAVELMLV
ncbi:MAG TPA: hypothetical protein VIV12_31305 [Streptosporangiaceae bacterium]